MLLLERCPDPRRRVVREYYRLSEQAALAKLLAAWDEPCDMTAVHHTAKAVIHTLRNTTCTSIDTFFTHYRLSSQEGMALMGLAEALLRVPDPPTIDQLIADRLSVAEWSRTLNQAAHWWLRLGHGALTMTRLLVQHQPQASWFKRLLKRSSEPIIRQAMLQAMRWLCHHFVIGTTIEQAHQRSIQSPLSDWLFSFDMLGEAARTDADAQRYFDHYAAAIEYLGQSIDSTSHQMTHPGISIKLSALHPKFKPAYREVIQAELIPRLIELATLAKQHHLNVTLDAEEADTLELMLDGVQALLTTDELAGWSGLGVAVQAYQKRAPAVIDWLIQQSHTSSRRLAVRLVKGAYWDTEIKRSQEAGHEQYPVYTRKVNTDLSYLVCARQLIQAPQIYPQFATHNAHTAAAVLAMIPTQHEFEFQSLFGMQNSLYESLQEISGRSFTCRLYAPVGPDRELLPYLIRRLLENGANNAFVQQLHDPDMAVEDWLHDPHAMAGQLTMAAHPHIPLPPFLYGEERANAPAIDLTDVPTCLHLAPVMEQALSPTREVKSLIDGVAHSTAPHPMGLPRDQQVTWSLVHHATPELIDRAFEVAKRGASIWRHRPLAERCACLCRIADALIDTTPALMALLIEEAGKTPHDAVAEIREAIDFCRYYAQQAAATLQPHILKGYTGEHNEMRYVGRGIVICISPWNFPLAIFIGQVVAALVTGNSVIAKPAEQTSVIAYQATQLCFRAGVPRDVLQLLLGTGELVGQALIAHRWVDAVMFTGSTQTAHLIQQQLAQKKAPIVPLSAETGGINAMIVDSSALYEQVQDDVLLSAFHSAGQRCSALRLLYLQEEVWDRYLQGLAGAMDTLRVGDPRWLQTDVGPVIDRVAQERLQQHIETMQQQCSWWHQVAEPKVCRSGHYVMPTACVLDEPAQLQQEIFGPVLHLVPYRATELGSVIDAIHATGFGLTLGIQSRIQHTIDTISERVSVGNCYVNRNMVGAVVGVQPFGGVGYSGTGPKAGGPHYLLRLCQERVISDNITARGGNTSLLTLS